MVAHWASAYWSLVNGAHVTRMALITGMIVLRLKQKGLTVLNVRLSLNYLSGIQNRTISDHFIQENYHHGIFEREN